MDMCSGSPGRRLASSSASRPAAPRQDDPRAFFTSESDGGPGHAPEHSLAVSRRGPCPALCPGHHQGCFHFVMETTTGRIHFSP